MPDLDKGQHGRVPIVLERSLADVQYSVHVSVVQQVGEFGLRTEVFSHTKSQLFDALFQYLPRLLPDVRAKAHKARGTGKRFFLLFNDVFKFRPIGAVLVQCFCALGYK